MTKQEALKNCKTGDSFTCDIDRRCSISGKIYMTPTSVYLCHDSRDASGSCSPDKLGYKYSWSFDHNVKNFKLITNEDDQAVVSQNPVIINNYAIY